MEQVVCIPSIMHVHPPMRSQSPCMSCAKRANAGELLVTLVPSGGTGFLSHAEISAMQANAPINIVALLTFVTIIRHLLLSGFIGRLVTTR